MLAKPGHLRAASAKVSRFDETVGVFSTAERKCGEEEDLWSRSGHDRDRVQLSVSAQFPSSGGDKQSERNATRESVVCAGRRWNMAREIVARGVMSERRK
uniref:(northern house mosquito) hypothetical protein n=1 Tax=Culex pipiens TaxID=7175 RepID=A0A8D8CUC6_CULPI